MTNHLLSNLHQRLFGNSRKSKQRTKRRSHRRTLAMESLESRHMLSITPLQNISASENTGEKPQSKVFEYAGQWWTVMPSSGGTQVFRLDGASWAPTQQITGNGGIHADVKVVDDLAHVLLFNGSSTQVATLQYDAVDNRFEPWALQPQPINVPLPSNAETATIEVDSTGRMWVANDVSSTVEVRYSDGLYTSWSAPITVASGIKSDDISSIIAMPNNSIGVFWSNQNSDRFGFRVHQDGAAPTAWSADEVPASQSALNVGGGMADDHMHLAAASDGTLYAAVKTSYDSGGYPKIALLVRRPNGNWDNLYVVDGSGTRPIVVLNEAAGKLIIAYTSSEGGGDIIYRESPLGNIAIGPRQVLINGGVNNVTSTKYTSTNEIVFLASSKGALYRFDNAPPNINQSPVVDAGPDRLIDFGQSAALDGTVSDDGLPAPAALSTLWTIVSGPGSVSFDDSGAVDTAASFDGDGTYVLRLTANDGQRETSDEMTVIVAPPVVPHNEAPVVNAGDDQSVVLGNSLALAGAASDDGLPAAGTLTTRWTKQSGPGSVAFANDAALETMASFDAAGTYVLRLTADDGELSTLDELTIDVAAPPVIVKRIQAANGTLYELDSEHWLSVNGTPTWADTHDFALAPDGQLYWLSTSGVLARRVDTGWQIVDLDVTKFVVANNGTVYSLAASSWLSVNGKKTWLNTRDFAIGADGAIYWLSTSNALYYRPVGGSWTFIDQSVTKFAVSQDGAAYALRADGWISVRGKRIWANTHDFILTDDQTIYWHSLGRSLYKKPSVGGWQFLGTVLQFAIRQDGVEYLLATDGSVRVGGGVEYTGVNQMLLDEFGRLVLERIGSTPLVISGPFTLGRKIV